MALKGNYNGTVIGVMNNSGSSILPYRVVKIVDNIIGYASAGDLNYLGVTLPDKRTTDQATENKMVVSVVLDGIAEVQCGKVINAGSLVKVGANGTIEECTGESAEVAIGIALEDGAVDSIIQVLLRPMVLQAGLIS